MNIFAKPAIWAEGKLTLYGYEIGLLSPVEAKRQKAIMSTTVRGEIPLLTIQFSLDPALGPHCGLFYWYCPYLGPSKRLTTSSIKLAVSCERLTVPTK